MYGYALDTGFLILIHRSCFPANRHQRTDIPAAPNGSQLDTLDQSDRSTRGQQSKQSIQSSSSDPPDCQSPRQAEPDLLYLNILNDAVEETAESSRGHTTTNNTPYQPSPEESFTPRNCLWTKLPQLDDIDNEYLVKKGVFDLPPPRYL